MNTFRSLLPATVGFDRLVSTMEEMESLFEDRKFKAPSYPPYNIYRPKDEYGHTTIIEIAVAGFTKEELAVAVNEQNYLVVHDVQVTSEKEEHKDYIHKGIGTRSFRLQFKLADNVIVDNVQLRDGILEIALEDVPPVENKLKIFDIK